MTRKERAVFNGQLKLLSTGELTVAEVARLRGITPEALERALVAMGYSGERRAPNKIVKTQARSNNNITNGRIVVARREFVPLQRGCSWNGCTCQAECGKPFCMSHLVEARSGGVVRTQPYREIETSRSKRARVGD